MLNEKKVKLMTKIAVYEKNNDKELNIASRSFKVDYVTLNMLYTAITTTIGYILLVMLYVLSNLESLFINVTETNFPDLINSVVKYYVICLVVFLVIALLFYSIKYDKSFNMVKRDFADWKSLSKINEK